MILDLIFKRWVKSVAKHHLEFSSLSSKYPIKQKTSFNSKIEVSFTTKNDTCQIDQIDHMIL